MGWKKIYFFIILNLMASILISCSIFGSSASNSFENLSEDLSNLSNKLNSFNNGYAAEDLRTASGKVSSATIDNQEIETALHLASLHIFAAENAITSDAVFDKRLIPLVLGIVQRSLYDASRDLDNASDIANSNGHPRVSRLLYEAGESILDAAGAINGRN